MRLNLLFFLKEIVREVLYLFLTSDKGEGDLIFDGWFTKLFINMKENGTFRYIQNIIRLTARPEVHLSNNINPNNYRPKKVSLWVRRIYMINWKILWMNIK